jgi:hypothetical protein
MLKKLALALVVAWFAASLAFAQPATTKPNLSSTLSQCGSNVPVVGAGAGNPPICDATGALTAPAFSAVGQLPGTATNNNATAGNVGEYISSTVLQASAVAATSGTAFNITSISLTPGDWDVCGNVATNPASTTVQSSIIGWISTTSATLPTDPNNGAMAQISLSAGSFGTGVIQVIQVGCERLSLASTTTVFLSGFFAFATSTNAGFGFIGARRAR